MSGYITFEERLDIESIIFQRCSFGEIAKKINKDRSTISREIRRHFVIEKSGLVLMLTAQELDRMHFKCLVALIKKL